ncbi:hypothetical protein [Helicobacter sp. UBA3407]|uniref:hypothetical protein n=1 Tax=Helicobacter sp. UBA3407 TaxID=1946588 RepID=UPI00261709BC|nr:hypothetical protein [Helicobacter sp. UBA3407]
MRVAVQKNCDSALRFISDDSRENLQTKDCNPKNCAFLITQSNQNYIESAKKNGFEIFIYPKDLIKYFDLDWHKWQNHNRRYDLFYFARFWLLCCTAWHTRILY